MTRVYVEGARVSILKGVRGGARGYGVGARGYSVGARGYGTLVIIVSPKSQLDFYVVLDLELL